MSHSHLEEPLSRQIHDLMGAKEYSTVLLLCQQWEAKCVNRNTKSRSTPQQQRYIVNLWKAKAYSKMKNWDNAYAVLESLPKSFLNNTIDALLLHGLCCLARNDTVHAVKSFRKVLSKDPTQLLAQTSLSAITTRATAFSSAATTTNTNNTTKTLKTTTTTHTNATKSTESALKTAEQTQIMTRDIIDSKKKKVPVAILSGFLGAGKTTLLNHILCNSVGLRVAVVVNDMASVNVDASLIIEQNFNREIPFSGENVNDETNKSSYTFSSDVVELSNGCICCTLREDLAQQLADLALMTCNDHINCLNSKNIKRSITKKNTVEASNIKPKYDYIFVESSGISEPLPVTQIFLLPLPLRHQQRDEEIHKDALPSRTTYILNDIAYVDALISVVDASNFWSEFASEHYLRDRSLQTGPFDNRTVVNLLTAQVEYANIVVINKSDLVSTHKVTELKSFLGRLNPSAKILTTTFSKVAMTDVIHTHAFNFKEILRSPGWLKELVGDHVSESEEFGFSSWIYRADSPFHAQRFHAVISGLVEKQTGSSNVFAGVLRSKGHFVLAEDSTVRWSWSSSFSSRVVRKLGALNDPHTFTKPRNLIEIVFIGIGMKEHQIREVLDHARITERELTKYNNIVGQIDHPWRRISISKPASSAT